MGSTRVEPLHVEYTDFKSSGIGKDWFGTKAVLSDVITSVEPPCAAFCVVVKFHLIVFPHPTEVKPAAGAHALTATGLMVTEPVFTVSLPEVAVSVAVRAVVKFDPVCVPISVTSNELGTVADAGAYKAVGSDDVKVTVEPPGGVAPQKLRAKCGPLLVSRVMARRWNGAAVTKMVFETPRT